MTVSSLGIGSGLDLNTILDGLMKLEAGQQNALKTKVTVNQDKVTQYQALNSKFLALKTASEALNLGSSWKLNKATSSDASVVATAGASALSGSVAFKVQNLAAANVMASSGTVSSLDAVVGSGRSYGGTYSALGISSATASSDLAGGKHALVVTQASQPAAKTGTAVAASTNISGSNNSLLVNVNGTASAITLDSGTYTRQQLVDQINTKAGGNFTASLNADNTITYSTAKEGSAASIRFTGGSALSSVGLTSGPAVNGTDGIITLDGVSNTITDTTAPKVLNSTTGTLTVNFAAGGVNAGTGNYDVYDYGDGKLSTIVNSINSVNGAMTAAAIQVAPGQYKLQLSSKETGVANALTVDPNMFSGNGLGTLQTVTAAKDATLTVGDGAGAYTITSASNTVKDALPGVTLQLNSADPSKTVTVGVGADADGMAAKVQAMVDAANAVNSFIKSSSTYDAASKSGGVFLGNSTTQRLSRQLFSELINPAAGTPKGASGVGIKTDSSGNLTFDATAFKAAYAADPEGVAAQFVEGGTTGTTTNTKPGIAERLAKLANGVTNSVDGQLTTVIKGVNTTITELNKQIESWDDRLAKRRETLTKQFAAMDTAVAGYKSTQTWLAGQITNLQANS